MSAIIYISGPNEVDPEGDCRFVNCTLNGIPFGEQAAPQFPPLKERVRHDYAYLADRPVDVFNSDRPVTRCDRCVKVAVTAILVCVFALAWSYHYLQALPS